jgi:hypothetical protein
VERFFFSTLVLRSAELPTSNGVDILKALAAGETGWHRWAETLRISRNVASTFVHYPAEEFIISTVEIQSLLASALKSMVHIRTFQ